MSVFLGPLKQGVQLLRRRMADVYEVNQQVWDAFNWSQFDGMKPTQIPRAGIELPEGFRILSYRGQGFAMVDAQGIPHLLHDTVLTGDIVKKRLEYEVKFPQYAPGQTPGSRV